MRQLLVVAALSGVALAEPYVAIGPPTFAGSLDSKHADDIDVMVKNHRDEYLKCYDGTSGELRMHVTLIVHPIGRVTGAGVALAKGTSPVVACVQGVLKNLRFDAQAEKITVDYAFVFGPTGTAGDLDGGRRVSVDEHGNVTGTDDKPADESVGGFGYGRAGFGPGGDATKWGSGGPHARVKAGPSVALGEATITGDLDKAIVRRYIKRNLNKIQYCYEKNLLVRPNIAGRLTTSFKIGSDGIVVGMKTDGFDKELGACVASVIKDIEFPKPKSGSVDIKYPFTFSNDKKK